jgi:hypothetical protein
MIELNEKVKKKGVVQRLSIVSGRVELFTFFKVLVYSHTQGQFTSRKSAYGSG